MQLKMGNVTYRKIGSKISRTIARWRFQAALRALKKLRVSVRGPFITARRNPFYVAGESILTESEILSSYTAGKLTTQNVSQLLTDLHVAALASRDDDPRNRRQSERVPLQMAVVIVAEMEEGKCFRTQAFTQVVNAHGGVLGAPLRMSAAKRFKLVSLRSDEEVGCRIVNVGQLLDGCFPTAFEFEQPNPEFWAIPFPPQDWALPKQAGTIKERSR